MIETGYEKILGIPSMQSILEFLSIYEALSIKDLMTYTGYSSRTLHDNLNLLKAHDIIKQEKRGIYKISDSRAIQLLTKFYEQIVIEQVSSLLHEITEKLDKGEIKDQSDPTFKKLELCYDHWKPIFLKYFPTSMQSILLKINE